MTEEKKRRKKNSFTAVMVSTCSNVLFISKGGFAGDNVVPEEYRLAKFAGMQTCATWNFGGARESALALLQSKWMDIPSLPSCVGV